MNLNRTEDYLRNEGFEGNNKDNGKPYDYRDIVVYKEYTLNSKTRIDLLDRTLKIIEEEKDLSIIIRQDLVKVVAELLEEDGYRVYVPKRPQNKGICILAERNLNSMGFTKYILMIRKISIGRKIGIGEIRKLEYLIQETNASKGILVTTGSLTKGAVKFIKEKPGKISYLEAKMLEQKLRDFIKRKYQQASCDNVKTMDYYDVRQ